MPSHEPDIRFDFKFTPVKFDKENHLLTFAAELDPERYEYQEKNGVKGYFDKFDNVFITEKFLNKMQKNIVGLPIYYSPSKIDDADEYIRDRIGATLKFFEKDATTLEENLNEDSKEFLESLKNEKMNFVILSVDLIDSTKMSQELPAELNIQIISLFLTEMTLLVDKFNGYVLKHTGDGLIAYFPEPDKLGKVDNALNCADLMRNIVAHVINPLLNDKGLSDLHFRIGLDSGKAIVKNVGIKGIKSSNELIGDTVNIAVKIQDLADDNQILVGASVVHNAHTFWRKRLNKFNLPKKWKYIDKLTKTPYPVYYLNDY